MTIDEAKQVFLSRGYVKVEGGTIYDANKWRESCHVISEWLEQEPCDFCKDIYPDNDTNDILFKKGKYSDFNKDSFITIDDEGKYWINIDPGDPYELGYLGNIKFCPYCGRKLEERSE